ncbi:MAG: hypothetical protein ACOYJ6_20725 [Caulobacterales bacterium]
MHHYAAKILLSEVEVWRPVGDQRAYVCLADGWALLSDAGDIQAVVLADSLDPDREDRWQDVHELSDSNKPADWFAKALWNAARLVPFWEIDNLMADVAVERRQCAAEAHADWLREERALRAEV